MLLAHVRVVQAGSGKLCILTSSHRYFICFARDASAGVSGFWLSCGPGIDYWPYLGTEALLSFP